MKLRTTIVVESKIMMCALVWQYDPENKGYARPTLYQAIIQLVMVKVEGFFPWHNADYIMINE